MAETPREKRFWQRFFGIASAVNLFLAGANLLYGEKGLVLLGVAVAWTAWRETL